ncbi:hypothetical protein J6590_107287 [Homalodisca vitripennis]|nr:hypothetical protein J6590_107287 [Homalodisca vitripennis]
MTRKHLENLREKNRAANSRFHLAIEKQAIYRRMTEMYRYTAAKESRPQVTCVAGFPLCRGRLHVLSREHRWSYTPERGHLELCEVLCPNCTASEKRSIFTALTLFPSDEESPSGVTSQA